MSTFRLQAMLASVLVFTGVLMLAELIISLLAPIAGANLVFYLITGIALLFAGTYLTRSRRH